MKVKEKCTKERILEEALKLFAQSGYKGTSMNDIAEKLGITKPALYKHYTGKQEILDSIVDRMNLMDTERAKKYEMPEGNMEEVITGYKDAAFDRIKEYSQAQFLHWTEDNFSSSFRKMLTVEQYRNPEMARLYQNYLAEGPISYMEVLFSGITENNCEAKQLALDFYGPIFLLYSIYDGSEQKDMVLEMLNRHVERFAGVLSETAPEGDVRDEK